MDIHKLTAACIGLVSLKILQNEARVHAYSVMQHFNALAKTSVKTWVQDETKTKTWMVQNQGTYSKTIWYVSRTRLESQQLRYCSKEYIHIYEKSLNQWQTGKLSKTANETCM